MQTASWLNGICGTSAENDSFVVTIGRGQLNDISAALSQFSVVIRKLLKRNKLPTKRSNLTSLRETQRAERRGEDEFQHQ